MVILAAEPSSPSPPRSTVHTSSPSLFPVPLPSARHTSSPSLPSHLGPQDLRRTSRGDEAAHADQKEASEREWMRRAQEVELHWEKRLRDG